MKLTVNKPVEIEPAFIRVTLPVNYEEEDIPNNFPLRNGESWGPAIIQIATGAIVNWPLKPGEHSGDGLAMKVVDGGDYELLDAAHKVLAKREGDYVPACIPGEYGDYVDFKIDVNGKITNWDCDQADVQKSFFPNEDD